MSSLVNFQHSHFNFRNLQDFSENDDTYILRLSQMFLQKIYEVELPKFKIAYEKNDLNSVWFHAHKMKSNLDMFNISQGLELIKEIEKVARYKEESPDIHQKVLRLYEILEEVEVALREVVEKHS